MEFALVAELRDALGEGETRYLRLHKVSVHTAPDLGTLTLVVPGEKWAELERLLREPR
jgi:hypothetical protein